MDKIDPFTQRMLERARIRKEKLEAKLPQSDKPVSRKPLSENNHIVSKSPVAMSPAKISVAENEVSVVKASGLSRKLTINSPSKPTTTVVREDTDCGVAVEINIVHQNNVQVDIQVEEREVTLSQYLKEKEENAKMTDKSSHKGTSSSGSSGTFYSLTNSSSESSSGVRADITSEGKNKLKRLGKLYADDGSLSSPINSRTELNFDSEMSPPTHLRGTRSTREVAPVSQESSSEVEEPRRNLRNRHAASRFAQLANIINSFEDDTRHFDFNTKDKSSKSSSTSTGSTAVSATSDSAKSQGPKPKPVEIKKRESPRTTRLSTGKSTPPTTRLSTGKSSAVAKRLSTGKSSTRLSSSKSSLASPAKSSVAKASPKQVSPVVDSNTYDKKRSTNDVQELKKTFQAHVVGTSPKKSTGISSLASKWDKSILADLESKGFKRVSVSQSRLVYDFSPSNHNHLQGDKQQTTPASVMAAATAVTSPSRSLRNNNITKRPSIKKHKAPAPPKAVENDDHEKENGTSDYTCESSVEDITLLPNGQCENDKETEPVAKQESACSTPELSRARSANSTSSSNRSSPISRDRRMADNSNVTNNGSPGGNVMSKAAIFESTVSSPRNTDPALMSMREKKCLFEKNKGAAIIPKAAFGMAPPIKALQNNANEKANNITKKPTGAKPKIEPKPSSLEIAPTHSSSAHRGFGSRMIGMLTLQPTLSEKEIVDSNRKQRDQEMLMLKNRFLKTKMEESEMDHIETEIDQDEQPTSEDSPLMGSGNHGHQGHLTASKVAASNASNFINTANIVNNKKQPSSPKVVLANPAGGDGENETDATVVGQPNKRRSSTDSAKVLTVLEDVKRIRVTAPKEGRLYPGLSDIDATTTEDEETKMSCLASLNTSSDATANEHVENDWGNTSFTRDILKAVGVKKTNESGLSKARKAVRAKRRSRDTPVNRNSRDDSYDSSSDGENNEDLDDLLDEVLDADDDTEGPTPPKQKNSNAVPSNSFYYKKGEPNAEVDRFKSPMKTPPQKNIAQKDIYQEEMERNKPLVHTVSFYRRQQSQGSQPNTPVRLVTRQEDQQQTIRNNKEAEELKRKVEKTAAVDSRQRVKELLEEVAKQNTVISQASQALNLCASTIEFSGSTEQAEGERLLLLATHRRQACLHEVQRIQVEGVPPSSSQVITLNMQDLSLPLRRDYVRQLNADALGHYLVCLIKCQERVIATSMVKSTPDAFSVTFPDKVRLEGLNSDFKVTIEVYALQASKEVLPHDVKYHIATKKSGKLATPRKGCRGADLRGPLAVSPGGPSAVRAPALQPHGYCIFGHSQVSRTSFSLNKASFGGPLEGTVRVTLLSNRLPSVTPQRAPLKGFLTMFEEAGGFGAWHRRWCVLSGPDLSYWRYPDHEGNKPPMGTIELSTCTSSCVSPAPRDVCARPNTLLLQTSEGASAPAEPSPRRRSALCLRADGASTHLLASDTRPERDQWMEAINTALEDIKSMAES